VNVHATSPRFGDIVRLRSTNRTGLVFYVKRDGSVCLRGEDGHCVNGVPASELEIVGRCQQEAMLDLLSELANDYVRERLAESEA
jgi:hypothetical protein